MTKFTPGPWTKQRRSSNMIDVTHNIFKAGAITHALCRVQARVTWVDEAEANARLIAAAPDMYAALQLFIIGANVSYVTALEIARAAIAKADGATT